MWLAAWSPKGAREAHRAHGLGCDKLRPPGELCKGRRDEDGADHLSQMDNSHGRYI